MSGKGSLGGIVNEASLYAFDNSKNTQIQKFKSE